MSFPTPQPLPPQPYDEPTQVQPAPRRSRRGVIIGLAAAIVLVAAGTATYFVAFSAVTIKGTVIVGSTGAGYGPGPSECHGAGAYADVTAGATVEITDGAGKTIALGKLGPGKTVNVSQCQFAFAVDAPRSDIYGIQVSRRGVLKYTRAEVQNGVQIGIGI